MKKLRGYLRCLTNSNSFLRRQLDIPSEFRVSDKDLELIDKKVKKLNDDIFSIASRRLEIKRSCFSAIGSLFFQTLRYSTHLFYLTVCEERGSLQNVFKSNQSFFSRN